MPRWKSFAFAGGATMLLLLCSVALYGLCLGQQGQFEAKLVELHDLKVNRERLETHNKMMHERVSYLKTDAGVEEIAREKLGLVRVGELAYSILPQPPAHFVATDEEETVAIATATDVDNEPEDFGLIVRVLRYLFGEAAESKAA